MGLNKEKPGRMGWVGDIKRIAQTFGRVTAEDIPSLIRDTKKQSALDINKKFRGDLAKELEDSDSPISKLYFGEFEPGSFEYSQQQKIKAIIDLAKIEDEEARANELQLIKEKLGIVDETGQDTIFSEDIYRGNFADGKEGSDGYALMSKGALTEEEGGNFDRSIFINSATGVYDKGMAEAVMKSIHEINTGSRRGYDAALPTIRATIQNIVYTIARIRKPNGRLNKDDIQRAALPLEGFKSARDIATVLDVFRREIQQAKEDLELQWFQAKGREQGGDEALLRIQQGYGKDTDRQRLRDALKARSLRGRPIGVGPDYRNKPLGTYPGYEGSTIDERGRWTIQ